MASPFVHDSVLTFAEKSGLSGPYTITQEFMGFAIEGVKSGKPKSISFIPVKPKALDFSAHPVTP